MDRSSTSETNRKTALVAVLGAILSGGAGLADDADSQKSASSIRQALIESYTKRQALSLEYRFTSSAMGTIPTGQYVRRVMAADRRGHFFLDNAHGHASMSFADDPYRRITSIGPNGFEIFGFLDRVVRQSASPPPPSLLRDLPGELVILLGWWPFLDVPERDMLGRKRSMEALKAEASYVLQPQAQIVAGSSCAVIEVPKVDTIWVDTSKAQIRRRELFDVETGVLARRIEFGDYRTIGEGVQIPMTLEIGEFDYAAQSSVERARCLNRIQFQILNATSNQEVDVAALVAAGRLPGTIQTSLKEKDKYKLLIEGEEDHARSIVCWGRRQLDPSDTHLESQPLSLLRPFLLCLSAGLASGCLILWIRSICYRTRKNAVKK